MNLTKNLFLLLCLVSFGKSQEKLFSLTISQSIDNEKSWWKEINNFGKSQEELEVDLKWVYQKNNFLVQLNLSNAYSSRQEKTFVRYVGNVNNNIHQYYIGESFLQLSKENKKLKVGLFYRDFSNYLNENLSSGSMLISNNSSPMPKISFLNNFKLKRNKKFSIQYGISQSWMKKEGYYIKSPWLHEKFIYLSKKNINSTLGVGLVHEAMWGGHAPEIDSAYPSGIKDFLKVFISADGPYEPPHANALGNHLGIWDFYYIFSKKNSAQLKLYYQHFFEDRSSMRFNNYYDGLWGLEIINKNKNLIFLTEYISTKNSKIDNIYQNDYYYWNYQYRVGWQNQNRIIGNPFVAIEKFQRREFNEAINLGISKQTDKLKLLLRIQRLVNKNDSLKWFGSLEKEVLDNLSFQFSIFDSNKDFSGLIGINIKL